MAYTSETDFLALLRKTSGGARLIRMPGLDYVLAALSRSGLFSLWMGATAPTVDQATTIWLQKAPGGSYSAESSVFLWDAGSSTYQPASPSLWAALFAASSGAAYVFQSVTGAAAGIGSATSLLAIQRAAPVTTALLLPPVATRQTKPLQIADWSSGLVADHAITVTAAAGEAVMRQPNLVLYSTAVQLSGVTLYPSSDLNGWVIAP